MAIADDKKKPGSIKVSRRAVTRRRSAKKRVTTRAKKRTYRLKSDVQAPVMVRNPAAAGYKRRTSSSKKVRRRFNIALNAPGAEVRLPALPMVHVGWRLVSLILSVGLLFGLYTLFTAPTFRVDRAEIYGLRRIPDLMVNTALGISGEPIFMIDENGMKDSLLEQFPEFSSAQVEVAMPNTVVISVTERIPVLAWIQGGRTLLVDEDGYAFELRPGDTKLPRLVVESTTPPPAPVEITVESLTEKKPEEELLDGEVVEEAEPTQPKRLITPEMVNAVTLLAHAAPEKKPIIYDKDHGLGWEDPRGWKVYFGGTDQIDTKMLVYGAIIERLRKEGIKPALISVEYVNAPFYRLKDND